jgi:dTMP kinase
MEIQMAGRLVVIEGMDGAGTTTQAKKLIAHLISMGHKALLSSEPTSSAIGQEIRKMLAMPLEHEPHLLTSLALCFAADRMHHIHHVIAPGLKNSDFVILDRYVLSSLVYQGLHLPTAFIKEINRFALKPDLTIVLDLEVRLAHERLRLRVNPKDFYESPSLLTKIRSRYLHFVEEEPANTVLVDAQGNIDEVHTHIAYILNDKFSKFC